MTVMRNFYFQVLSVRINIATFNVLSHRRLSIMAASSKFVTDAVKRCILNSCLRGWKRASNTAKISPA